LKVVVLDDHRMVGQALAGVLSEVAGLMVIGVCASVGEASALIRANPPRLLVLDVELGGERYRDAADLLLQLNPQAELLFVTALADQFTPPADLMAKTIGVVNKAQAWDELLAVVQRWWKGRQDDHPELLPGCNQQLSAIYLLSPREQRVLRELGCGLLNKEIALRLDLSVSTVESYRKSMAGKLGVSGAELVRLATLHRALSWDAPSIEEA
jgi:DNA-binding NarL/FixJ family response regulator